MRGDERFVCSSCGHLVEIGENYCDNCSAPTNSAFNLDPMTAIESEGDLFVRAAEGRQKPIVLVGSWIMFFPAIVVLVAVAFSSIFAGPGPPAADLVFFAVGMLLATAFSIILFRITRNYFRSKDTRSADEAEDSAY